jgi:hypothetical protein
MGTVLSLLCAVNVGIEALGSAIEGDEDVEQGERLRDVLAMLL